MATTITASKGTVATKAGVQTLTTLKAIGTRTDKEVRLVEDSGIQYRWDSDSSATSDDFDVVRPTDIASDGTAGRWLRIYGNIQSVSGRTGVITIATTDLTDWAAAPPLAFRSNTNENKITFGASDIGIAQKDGTDLVFFADASGEVLFADGGRTGNVKMAVDLAAGGVSIGNNVHGGTPPTSGLYVEGSVGIGDESPGTQLQLSGTTPYVTLKNSTSENTAGGCESKIVFEDHGNNALGQIEVSHSGSSDDEKGQLVLSTNNDSGLQAALTINEAQKITAAGDVQVTGDIILDDGGSLKEAGGTAAFTFDGSGNVTKIGVSSQSSGHFLKYDGSKYLLAAVSGEVAGGVAADDINAGDAAVSVATSSGAVVIDSNASTVTVDGHTGVTVTSSNSGEVDITSAANVDINATTGVTIDGTTVSIDGTDTTNLTMTANSSSAKALTIDAVNSGSGVASISLGTTSATAISIGHSTSETTVNDNLTVTGNLTVDGTTTTINSTTLTVDDKVVVIASGAADSAAADGAGISVDGASATILYDHTGTQWEMNKPLEITGTLATTGDVTFGVDDTGVDVRMFSATASEGVLYDASEDELALLLTTKLKFHDVGGGEEIFASANGHLEINAGTTLDVTAPTVDINSSTEFNIDTVAYDLNASGAVTVDAAGVSIDSAGVAANFTVASDGAAEDLTIEVTGATDSSVVISSSGTGADAIDINTTAGSIDIDSADNITIDAADEIAISTTSADGHISLVSAHTSGVAFHIDANADAASEVQIDAGVLDIDVTAGITIDGTTLSVDGTDDSNLTVTASGKDLDIAVAGGGTQELRLASAGTGGSALHLNASAGSVDIDSADNVTVDAADEITLTTTSADGHISLVSAHTAGVAFHIDANADAASEVQIDAGVLDVDVTAGITIDGTTLSVDGTDDSNLTVTGSGKDLDIAVAGGSTQELRLASAGTGASALHLNASAGSVDIDSADAITIDAADEIVVTTTSADGHISLVSAHTAGVALHIDANADAGSIVDLDAGILDVDVTGAATIDAASLTVTTDSATFTSANSTDPLILIKNTTNDANGSRLRFLKDKGAAGADNDVLGILEFYGDDSGQNETAFATIKASISESAHTDEAGKLEFFVAESDGTTTALTAGLTLEGEHATDGEVDVTIAAGASSTTTVAGDLVVTSTFKATGVSLSNNDSGTSNTVLGLNAGANIASGGNYNLLVGENAGNDLTTGDDNIIIGYNTGVVATTTSDLVVIGSGAGAALAAGSTDADGTVLIGKGAGAAITSGQYNVAIGFGALDAEDLGNGSVAIGYNALTAQNSNQGGSAFGDANHNMNTAVGMNCSASITSGQWNVAMGSHALNAEVAGDSSTAIGTFALYAQTGTDGEAGNTALGYWAGKALTTGKKNVFIGKNAGDATTDVDKSVIIGYSAAGANMTAAADGTVMIGANAGEANTVGAGNVGVGQDALKTNVDGGKNTAIGSGALETMEPGTEGHGRNTAIGYNAGTAITTGIENTIIGGEAGDALAGGSNNVFIGASAGGSTTAAGDVVAIGECAGSGVLTTDANGSVFIGHNAGKANTEGAKNVGIGKDALSTNVDGDFNTAIGYDALKTFEADTNGHGSNTAVGYQAGTAVSTGTGNTILGANAGDALAGGDDNVFLGVDAGGATTAGGSLVIIGKGAGVAVLTSAADGTIIVGAGAGAALTSGDENTVVGYQAMKTEDAGGGCTALGYKALTLQNVDSAKNTAVGNGAGQLMTGSVQSTYIGFEAGKGAGGDKPTGENNTFVGYQAGVAHANNANNNTMVGHQAGDGLTTGDQNTGLGSAVAFDVDANNQTCVGYGATTSAANAVKIGNASVSAANIQVDWTIDSDERIKQDIESNTLGLAFINDLTPRKYRKLHPADWAQEIREKRYETDERDEFDDAKVWDGLIAQEVKEAIEKSGTSFSGWSEDANGKQGIQYSALVVPLIKAVQELSAQVAELQKN